MIGKRVLVTHMSSNHADVCHHWIASQAYFKNKLKLALIGQSLFGQEVYSHLRKEGHRVVGVFTVPDKDGKTDPLGECILEQLNQGLCTDPAGSGPSSDLLCLVGISKALFLCHSSQRPRLPASPLDSASLTLPLESLLKLSLFADSKMLPCLWAPRQRCRPPLC